MVLFHAGWLSGAQVRPAQDSYLQQLGVAKLEADKGDISAARADIESAIAAEPDRSAGWYQLGLLFGQTGDFHAAGGALRKAIELQPDFAVAHFSLGLAAIANPEDKADWTGAMAQCREALKYQPDYPDALNLLGVGQIKSGLTDEAITNFQRAIKLSPSMAEAHFNLGMAFDDMQRPEQAELEYRAAIAKGTYPEAAIWLSKLLFRQGKTAEAERESMAALRANPDLAEAHYTLARILRSLHRDKAAKLEFAEFEDLSQRLPDGIQSSQLSNQGLEFARKGDAGGAEASLRESIALKPDYGVAHYNLGLVLAAAGDISAAIPELKKAISLLPGEPRPWFDLGRVLQLAGENSEALSAMDWASHLAPSDATISATLKSLRESLRAVLPATGPVAANPSQFSAKRPEVGAATDTALAHVAFANELTTKGDFQGAIGELLRSLTLRPSMADARSPLACAYLHHGDKAHAMLEYYKVLTYGARSKEYRDARAKLLSVQGGEAEISKSLELRSVCGYASRSSR